MCQDEEGKKLCVGVSGKRFDYEFFDFGKPNRYSMTFRCT